MVKPKYSHLEIISRMFTNTTCDFKVKIFHSHKQLAKLANTRHHLSLQILPSIHHTRSKGRPSRTRHMQRLILRPTPRTLPITLRHRGNSRAITPHRQRLKIHTIRHHAPRNARTSRRHRRRDDRARRRWRRSRTARRHSYSCGYDTTRTAAGGLIDGGNDGWAAAGLYFLVGDCGTGDDGAGLVRVAGRGGGSAGYCDAFGGGSSGGSCGGWVCGGWALIYGCVDCDWGFLSGDGGEEEAVRRDVLLDESLILILEDYSRYGKA